MNAALCDTCGRETDARLCGPCTAGLARGLRTVPELLVDLDLTLARADKIGSAGRGGETPVPWKEHVPDAVWVLGNVITVWIRETAESRGLTLVLPPRPARPARAIPPGARADREGRPAMDTELPDRALDTIRVGAQWLVEHLVELRHLDDADQAHDELTDALRNARHAVDRPAARIFVGPCDECGEDLYGVPHRARATCAGCGAVYEDMVVRWEGALRKLRGYPATASTIAAMAGELYGVMIDRKLINQWASRGDIRPVDQVKVTEDGQRAVPRFRFGDVLDRAARSAPRARRHADAAPSSGS